MKLILTPRSIKELSHLEPKEAKKVYKKVYWKTVWSRHGVVGALLLLIFAGAFDYFFGDAGRILGGMLGAYFMSIYLFHKMDFSDFSKSNHS